MSNQHITALTTREQIAASALQGLIAAYGSRRDNTILATNWKQGLARSAVQYADELLNALGEESKS